MRIRHRWFPDDLKPDSTGLVGVGADLEPETLIEAYAKGIFPWSGDDPIPWYSPDPRLVLFPDHFRASRSLKKLARQGKLEVRFDRDFPEVMRGCAEIPRPGQDGTWINDRMIDAYTELHRRGVAHCVSVYQPESGDLVGGLYGLTLGRFFFGESMFSRASNSSKLALFALCENLVARDFELVDCQQVTPHLMSLGAVPIMRREFLARLRRTLHFPSLHVDWGDWRFPLEPP